MYFIIGLGNPGSTYEKTRHNLGFLFIDFLAEQAGVTFTAHKKVKALTCEVTLASTKVFLIKPEVFMNCSGETVASILQFYKGAPDDILVVHDDLDIASGDYRIATGRGAAGHNGVQNIIDILKTKDFSRIRIGIGRITPNDDEALIGERDTRDYVLGTLTEKEKLSAQKLFPTLLPEIEKMILKNRP
jgi:PTH1 family peptidyl-tRNA hydrolase